MRVKQFRRRRDSWRLAEQCSLDPQCLDGLDAGRGPGGPEAGQQHDDRE